LIVDGTNPGVSFADTPTNTSYFVRDWLYANIVIDVITVTDALKRVGKLENCGGSYYLTQLVNSCISAGRIEQHAEIVKECWRKKKTFEAIQKAQVRTVGNEPSDEVINDLESDFF
jgi:replicative DNA helicase